MDDGTHHVVPLVTHVYPIPYDINMRPRYCFHPLLSGLFNGFGMSRFMQHGAFPGGPGCSQRLSGCHRSPDMNPRPFVASTASKLTASTADRSTRRIAPMRALFSAHHRSTTFVGRLKNFEAHRWGNGVRESTHKSNYVDFCCAEDAHHPMFANNIYIYMQIILQYVYIYIIYIYIYHIFPE